MERKGGALTLILTLALIGVHLGTENEEDGEEVRVTLPLG